MINLLKRLNQHRTTRIVVPVFLGFVVLSASLILPAGSNQVFNFQNDSTGFIKSSSSVFMNHPEENSSGQGVSYSSGGSFNWNSTSKVLP